MEEDYENEGEKIKVYGNLTEETFGEINKFDYLCGKYD